MSLKPPFTPETALKKVKLAQDLWNTRTPSKVALAYTTDTIWRNRDTFLKGREAVEKFLEAKWSREHHYVCVLMAGYTAVIDHETACARSFLHSPITRLLFRSDGFLMGLPSSHA